METKDVQIARVLLLCRPDHYGDEDVITGESPSEMHPARTSIAVVPIALPNLRLRAARTAEADAPRCARDTWSTPRWMFAATAGTKSAAHPMSMRTTTSTTSTSILVHHRTLVLRS